MSVRKLRPIFHRTMDLEEVVGDCLFRLREEANSNGWRWDEEQELITIEGATERLLKYLKKHVKISNIEIYERR